MEDNKGNEREELYSQRVRAGKRTYFFDVRTTRGGDYYVTITESKKVFNDDGFYYQKHKIFLYKEDFNKFQDAVNQYSISETRNNNGSLGWIESSKLNSTYKMQLQGLKIGQLTKPIKVNEGFVVIRLNDIKTQRVEETDIEKIKNDIVIKMKNEKLNFYSRSHFNKVKNKSLIISK